MKMKNILSIASLLVVTAAFSFGCSSSSDNGTPPDNDSGTGDSIVADTGHDTATTDSGHADSATDSGTGDSPSDTPGFPAAPTLGTQIDRMGRPAVNTAANHTFDSDAAAKGAAKDAYNQDNDPTHWSSFVPEIEKNLGILDALDGTCGNQLLADTTKTDASRYGTLAGILANDQLWLNTAVTTCTAYLAVETGSTTDCGGRAPSYDVMNLTYDVVAGVALTAQLDGITTVPDRSKGTTFPYLPAPH